VEQLCLSILYEGEASGYDISRRFVDGEEALFADASTGAIYPALAKLKAKGFVSLEVEEQVGKPSRNIYRITDDGRAAFIEGLGAPPSPDKFESSFLHFLRFAHLAPPEAVEAQLRTRHRHLSHEIDRLNDLLSENSLGPQRRWILEHGLCVTQAMHDSLQAITRKICGKTKPPTKP
jgi:DNA-binding PadR family transcriptional regulator